MQQLLKLMVAYSEAPVTVKMRLGWDTSSAASDIARYARDAGVAAVCVHGRTCVQGYNGRVDYEGIRKVKKSLDIPVIASGDIFTPVLARKMFDETGCDAVMVARGALGNPWIFRSIAEFFANGVVCDGPGIDEVIGVMKKHLSMNIEFFGENSGVIKFKKFYLWYIRGLPGIRRIKNDVLKVKTENEMHELMEKIRIQGLSS